MTKSQLVDAFTRGELDRRHFIHALKATGVSAVAAAAYATTLAPQASADGRNGLGFIARAQDVDEDYGTTFPIEDVEAAITALTDTITEGVAALTILFDSFTVEDFLSAGFEQEVRELLQTIQAQLQEQLDALNALLESAGAAGSRRAFQSPRTQAFAQSSPDNVQDALVSVSDALNQLVGVLAAVSPALETGKQRQLATNIGLVSARHAALVTYFADNNPIPGAFEVPIDPATVS